MQKLLIPLAIGATILFSGCSKKQDPEPSEPKVIKKINITIKNGGECSLPANNDYMTIPHE
jgi:hypothetical protein